MGRCLYWQCDAGISGDMAVASLLDLGADEATLREALASLDLDGYEVAITRVRKSGLDVCDFDVVLDDPEAGRDHDMDYLHGGGELAAAGSDRDPECDGHDHNRGHGHDHGHDHVHRNLAMIEALIDGATLSVRSRSIAKRVFRIVAEAEAAVHGATVESVHFHEVGAVDSIVDIVAAAVCIDDLDIDRVVVERLCDGRGFIRCQHGRIPVPAPAVAAIASAYELPLTILPIEGELVTPTGAALVAALRTDAAPFDPFLIKAVGMGAGKRTYPTSGLLRALLIEPGSD